MRLRRRPPPVHVDLSETPESRAKKAAEAEWARVNAHVQEHRRLRQENNFGPRFAAAFRLHERTDGS